VKEDTNGNFEFYDNYIDKVMELQPEYYSEIKKVVDTELKKY